MISGRTLVLATFGIGLAMASAAWVYKYQQSRRVLEFWGAGDAGRIVGATDVELLDLKPAAGESAGESPLPGYVVEERHDLSNVRGLTYLGYTLTQDANFDWDAKVNSDANPWGKVLRFTMDGKTTTVLLAEDLQRLAKLSDGGEPVALACPRMKEPLATFLTAAIAEAGARAAR